MGNDEIRLAELREQATKVMTASQAAVLINREILEIDPDDLPAANRLGRFLQDLGQLEEARAVFDATLERRPGYAYAAERIELIERQLAAPPTPVRRSAKPRAKLERDLDTILAVLDGSARSDCLRVMARAIEVAQSVDSARLAVTDIPSENRFRVVGGINSSVAPFRGTLFVYVDQRSADAQLVDDVKDAGGRYTPTNPQGAVPHSIGLGIPFGAVAEFAERVEGSMADHIRASIEAGAPTHMQDHNPALMRRVLQEGRAAR